MSAVCHKLMGIQSATSSVRAVTFDAGGTLIEPWPSVGHVYAQVAAEHGFGKHDPRTLTRNFRVAWKAKRDFSYTFEGWAALVDQTFAGLVKEPPSRTFFPALYARFAEASAWRVFDDVLPALETLASRGFKLGVVSNWDERLKPLLRRLKLASYFDAIVVSCECAFTKPSPVIFEQALRALGLPPQAVLHVGDGLEEDVRCAQAAGLQALHLQRGKTSKPGEIGSLRELERLLSPSASR
ncbi:MAG: HAD-IA family hydrolase [Verrucomicrobia bacterium]|nr:HAD-IA family hydrolase [Verrucomicrobiota bacterium]